MNQNTSSAPKIKAQDKNKRKRSEPKRPKKITETYLHNSGLYYLERYATSAANFETVMMRKVKKSCAYHEDQSYEACAEMVKALVEKLIRLELLDDEVYTRVKLRGLRQRGKSKRFIVNYLRSKGISPDLTEKHLSLYNQEIGIQDSESEYETAIIFARKKRIGPFRISDKNTDEKDLGKLARAGFSYDTARRVLKNKSDVI